MPTTEQPTVPATTYLTYPAAAAALYPATNSQNFNFNIYNNNNMIIPNQQINNTFDYIHHHHHPYQPYVKQNSNNNTSSTTTTTSNNTSLYPNMIKSKRSGHVSKSRVNVKHRNSFTSSTCTENQINLAKSCPNCSRYWRNW